MSVGRFANSGLNGHFEHSHLIVFKKKLVFFGAAARASFSGVHHLSKLVVVCPNKKPALRAPTTSKTFASRFMGSSPNYCPTFLSVALDCSVLCVAKYRLSLERTHDALHPPVHCWRSGSDLVFFESVNQVIAGPHRDGHHRERRILAARRDETRSVHGEDVLDVVQLTVLVGD